MVRQGQPKQLKNTYIEKGKYRIDTPGEKKGLSVAKYKRQRARETFGVVSKPKSRRQTATVISRRPARKRGVPFRL